MAVALSVNLNKIALLRNSRAGNFPDVLAFARRGLELGVNGITVHPRPDQRHIRAADSAPLATLVKQYPRAEFNIEGNPFAESLGDYPGFIPLVKSVKPHQCTLVPDTNDQLTSDHGFDLHRDGDRLLPILQDLCVDNIRTSLFMDPDIEQIRLAKEVGADRIELYTGPYAAAYLEKSTQLDEIFAQFEQAAIYAQSIGLGVNAGHDLNLHNLPRFASIPGLLEVSIGHALTIDALSKGWDTTIQAYLAICQDTP